MEKLWAGRFQTALDKSADDFNASIGFDSRLYRQDIKGSVAHATMLGAQGILPAAQVAQIVGALGEILDDLDSGKLCINPQAEDIHMFVEAELTARIGEAGKMLHTARSRNDQVALDLRLYLREQTQSVIACIRQVLAALVQQAKQHVKTIMPGYTHLQRAQPVSFGHYMMAYAMMLTRDIGRFSDAAARMNESPLGCCALAGTGYPTDRKLTASLLGFDGVTKNSLDGVSDRDFCVELAGACATLMMHLSRLSEELILWSSWEFRFITLSDAFSTGSSIMPQKKNPDMAELIRGKTGRVYGDLMTLLTLLKALPLAYNKDMQEDKEAIFDSMDTVLACLNVLAPMLRTMQVNAPNLRKAVTEGFLNATDCADYLVKKGLPFRSAYQITGKLVALCIERKLTLEELPLAEYQAHSALFADDLYAQLAPEVCLESRQSQGGPGEASVLAQIEWIEEFLNNDSGIY